MTNSCWPAPNEHAWRLAGSVMTKVPQDRSVVTFSLLAEGCRGRDHEILLVDCLDERGTVL